MYLESLPPPTVTPTNAGFWAAAADGRLDVQVCTTCGTHRHPPTEACWSCASLDWAWDTLPGTGRVFTFTWVVHAVHPAVAERVPYNVTVVALDGVTGGPVRIVTNIIDATRESLAVGMPVSLACERLTDSVGLPRFRLA